MRAEGHDLALYRAHRALAQIANLRGQPDTIAEEVDRAFEHAQRAGVPLRTLVFGSMGRYYGSAPVGEFLAWLDEQSLGEVRGPLSRSRQG